MSWTDEKEARAHRIAVAALDVEDIDLESVIVYAIRLFHEPEPLTAQDAADLAELERFRKILRENPPALLSCGHGRAGGVCPWCSGVNG